MFRLILNPGFALLFAFAGSLFLADVTEAQPLNCEVGMVGSILADPGTITMGGSSTLQWFIDGPNECPLRINGQPVPLTPNTMQVSPSTTTTYLLSTVNIDGSDRPLEQVSVVVQPVDCETQMSGDISANPERIAPSGSSRLTWSIDGPAECPLRVNGKPVSLTPDSMDVQPNTPTTYVLSTVKLDGSDHPLDDATITVDPDCVLDTKAELTAIPRTVPAGGTSTLTWKADFPSFCNEQVRINGQKVFNQGAMVVRPVGTMEYKLTADFTPGGTTLAAVAVKAVTPKVVYILGNTTSWKDLLVTSVGEDGTTVILGENVNMDLTGYGPIYIRESVALVGYQSRPGGRNARQLGPRLFTLDRPKPLFLMRCNADGTILGNNVRIANFRLHGPHFEMESGDDNLESGISIDSCLNIEIDNMEVAGWSGSAIAVSDPEDNQTLSTLNMIRIHDNFLHHNQHKGGNGYGVVVGDGAWASIYRNVFDFNRHGIAASGTVGGYRADSNLVLKGGGRHGRWYNEFTHQFDVHGDKNCGPGSHLWNCGRAGYKTQFFNNTFQYRKDNAIKIRGVPRIGAYFGRNVFAHGDLDDAIVTYNGTRIFYGRDASRNITGVDSYGEYGVCDFDGDGMDDLFLPTGQTWWFASAATMHWTYLKAATERLNAVGLGYFDGDKRCDVLAANGDTWEISPGGSGAWTALPGVYPVPFDQLRFADFNGDGRTDVFRRAPNGQWQVVSPGVHGWRNLANSNVALKDLRFGDFTGDGTTDVLSRAGGRWSISRSGSGSWERLNPKLDNNLASLLIADVNGDRIDDIVRSTRDSSNWYWEISWSGRGPWTRLHRNALYPQPPQVDTVRVNYFVGRFDESRGVDVLDIAPDRRSYLYSHTVRSRARHNLFAQ